ncbi:hypothetical protein D3C72_281410 [compost metagenome]
MLADIVSSDVTYAIRVRVLQTFAALENAGATPISNRDLQAVVYLSNVLSPVWGIEPLEGAVLKTDEGPRSIKFESELDACVGLGLVRVDSIQGDEERPDKLSACFSLAGRRAAPLLEVIQAFPDERYTSAFLNEVAFAFVEIAPGLRDDAAIADAAWTNPSIVTDRVVRFAGEGATANQSYNVTQAFQAHAPAGQIFTPAQQLDLYVRLLKRRVNG